MAKVLIQGVPFLVGDAAIRRYRGPHDLKWICGLPHAPEQGHALRYDMNRDNIHTILGMLGPWRPDLVLFFSPEDQTPPDEIEHCPVKTVAIPADWSHAYPRMVGTLGSFDVAASDYPGSTRVAWGQGLSTRYFGPVFSYTPEFHRDLSLERDIDVLYAGSMNHALRPQRGILVPRLEALSNRYHIHITDSTYGEDYIRLMSRAKLVFNYSARGELNMRFFETLACGGVPMVERDNPEVHQDFRDGEDVLLFGLDDFEQCIESLLSQPQRVDALRRKAAARAPEYAPEVLLDRFIEAALAAPDSGRPTCAASEQERLFRECTARSGSIYDAVRVSGYLRTRRYVERYPADAAGWTLLALHLVTPMLHPFLACDNEAALQGPARQLLEKAAALAPNNALHLANAAWVCQWCGDAPAAKAYAQRALDAPEVSTPELLIGSLTDPPWARYMQATAEGATGEIWRALLRDCLAKML